MCKLVEWWRGAVGDEELGSAGVGQRAVLAMLSVPAEVHVRTSAFSAFVVHVVAGSAGTVAFQTIGSRHEAGEHAVEGQTVVEAAGPLTRLMEFPTVSGASFSNSSSTISPSEVVSLMRGRSSFSASFFRVSCSRVGPQFLAFVDGLPQGPVIAGQGVGFDGLVEQFSGSFEILYREIGNPRDLRVARHRRTGRPGAVLQRDRLVRTDLRDEVLQGVFQPVRQLPIVIGSGLECRCAGLDQIGNHDRHVGLYPGPTPAVISRDRLCRPFETRFRDGGVL